MKPPHADQRPWTREDLGREEIALLDLIWLEWIKSGAIHWPSEQHLRWALEKRGVDMDDATGRILGRLVVEPHTDAARGSGRRLALSLPGLACVDDATALHVAEPFLRFLASAVRRYDVAMQTMASTESRQVEITPGWVYEDWMSQGLPAVQEEIDMAARMFAEEPGLWVAWQPGPGEHDWKVQIDHRLTRYRNVETVGDYLAVRAAWVGNGLPHRLSPANVDGSPPRDLAEIRDDGNAPPHEGRRERARPFPGSAGDLSERVFTSAVSGGKESPTASPHFFISRSGEDSAWAEWIAWQLEKAGFRCHLQDWDFRDGQNFVLNMQRGAEAERTIAVLSDSYLRSVSGYPEAEWAAAFCRDPRGVKGILLPVRVRECVPTGLLGSLTYIDLVGLDEQAARTRLLKGVKSGRAKPDTPPSFPSHPNKNSPAFPRLLELTRLSTERRQRLEEGQEKLLGSIRNVRSRLPEWSADNIDAVLGPLTTLAETCAEYGAILLTTPGGDEILTECERLHEGVMHLIWLRQIHAQMLSPYAPQRSADELRVSVRDIETKGRELQSDYSVLLQKLGQLL